MKSKEGSTQFIIITLSRFYLERLMVNAFKYQLPILKRTSPVQTNG